MATIRSKMPGCWYLLLTTLARRHIRFASTLVIVEHDRGKLKDSSLSAIAAIGGLGESNTILVLLGGSGRALQQAAASASKAQVAITKGSKSQGYPDALNPPLKN